MMSYVEWHKNAHVQVLGIAVLLLVAIAVPFTLFQTQQEQVSEQHAVVPTASPFLQLTAGWSLMTPPVSMDAKYFMQQSTSITEVAALNGSVWQTLTSTGSGIIGNDFILSPNRGYFVRTVAATQIPVALLSTSVIDLTPGLNVIGFSTLQSGQQFSGSQLYNDLQAKGFGPQIVATYIGTSSGALSAVPQLKPGVMYQTGWTIYPSQNFAINSTSGYSIYVAKGGLYSPTFWTASSASPTQ